MIRHEASHEERGKLSAGLSMNLIDHDSSTGNDLISRVSYNSSAAKRGSREYPLFLPFLLVPFANRVLKPRVDITAVYRLEPNSEDRVRNGCTRLEKMLGAKQQGRLDGFFKPTGVVTSSKTASSKAGDSKGKGGAKRKVSLFECLETVTRRLIRSS